MMPRRYFTLVLFFLLHVLAYSQNVPEKGLPLIQNYLPEDYGNHGKVWEISSAKNALVYMASDNGLLEFDGKTWNRFRDYRGYTRSLCIASDSTIFVGADMDFGVWKKDRLGKFSFTSYYPFKKKIGGTNEEFWGTYKIEDRIVFVSHQNIYTLNKGKVAKISAPNRFSDSFQTDGKIYLADEKSGFYEFDGGKLRLLFQYPNHIPLEISGIFKNQNSLIIVTKDKGIFQFSGGVLTKFTTSLPTEIFNAKVFSFITIENKYLAFGTILNGLYITDLSGKIIQHFNKGKGLPNNTVLSIFYQKNGKLWLGLDYGIASININSNITYFHSTNADFGTGYAVALQNNVFYLGTNQGLYTANWENLNNIDERNPFQIVGGSEGQVWTLENLNGKILCGHDEGLFEVEGRNFTKIYDEAGIQSLYQFNGKYLLAGTYNGISVLEKSGETWKFLKKMPVILGSVSQIVKENNQTFWANIPNYGLIRFSLDQNFSPQNRQIINAKSLKGYFPHLFKNQSGIHVITNASQYRYDLAKKNFVEEPISSKNNEVKGIFSGSYFPIKFTENYGFYPVNNGFALEDFNSSTPKNSFHSQILLRKFTAFNNEEVSEFSVGEKIPYRFNNINISFLLPNEDGVQYQYFLDNYSKNWSNWNTKNIAEFVGLREGNYTLKVKAKKGNQISNVEEFQFKINPPWYRSFWSFLLYILAIFGAYQLLKKYQKYKLRKQKLELLKKEQNSLREQAEKHRQELLLEKQKQLEFEKSILKDEIRNKTIELATKAKEDEDKNRILHIIGDKIVEIEGNPNISKIRLGEIRRMLKNYLETEDKTFEIQMDELHQEFFKAMKLQFPNLSIYDLRLCAYLKLGLTSREMSEILQVLPSSINVSRSRLRKKLGLAPEDDLFAFLNRFG